jgi:hypothetical protein
MRVLTEGAVITASILLAFALDAWWDRSRERVIERELVTALLTEFHSVEAELRRARSVHEARGGAATTLVNMIDEGARLPSADSLWVLLESAGRRTTIDPPSGTLSGSINAGTLTLIQNDSLRTLLAGWPGLVADHQKSEENVRGYINEVLLPWQAEWGVHPPLSGVSDEWYERADTFMRQRAHRGHLWNMTRTQALLTESDRLLDRATTIQRLLLTSGG